MNNTHNVNYRSNCSQCSKVFNTNQDLDIHINQSHVSGFSIEAAFNKMSEKFDTFSERLQILEHKSLTNFPNLGPQLREK